ncbi:hypothetical protein WJX73_007361 [Symbiochloris irregularis]|uniref:Uncharacterized protein n=1 Tax=Symbiochloris irregularis TaxID=706552 RepID=A0AAW1PWH9_9CHLO
MSSHQAGEFVVALGEGQSEQGEKKALSPVYRNVRAKDSFPSKQGIKTLFDQFEASVKSFPDRNCLGWRPIKNGKAQGFSWYTFKETHAIVKDAASAMATINIKPGGKIGIYSINCPEFMLVIQAANRSGSVLVPLYDSLGEDAVEYTVNHSQASAIFLQGAKFPALAKAIANIKKNAKTLVYWGEADGKLVKDIENQGVKVITWKDFLAAGKQNTTSPNPPKESDLATIMYTSGTTGNPKGVELTHKNILSTVIGLQEYTRQGGMEVRPDDSILSYLTMAHIFGRVSEEFAIACGAAIGYWQGDVKLLTQDVAELRPSIFIAVPRVLERMQGGIAQKLKGKGFVVQLLLSLALRYKIAMLHLGYDAHAASPFLDSTLFKPFKKAFGGRVRFIVSGGAPLAKHVEEYLAASLGAPVFQGYGLTETCGASFVGLPRQAHSGTVGPPTTSLELRFEGNSELGYDPLAKPPRGEICVRGPQVFAGYHNDKKKTDEAFDKDGYFHSGDVGELTPAGCLKVIDRLKNMFKLAQGEYIAAEKLEQVYKEAENVAQVWVYGNSLESTLVAVVVPEERDLKKWASANGVSGSFSEICKDKKARQYVLEDLNKAGKNARVKGFERIAAVWLEPEEWSVDNDMMTPSFKLKRPQLQKKYQKQIDEMYKSSKK